MSFLSDIFIYLLFTSGYWWAANNISFFGLVPNLVFLTAVAAAVYARPAKAMAYGFLLGLFLDIFGSNLIGAYALAYTLMAYCIYVMKRHFDLLSPFSQGVTVFLMSHAVMLFYQILHILLVKTNLFQLKIFLAEPFLNLLAAPLVFYVLSRMHRKLGAL